MQNKQGGVNMTFFFVNPNEGRAVAPHCRSRPPYRDAPHERERGGGPNVGTALVKVARSMWRWRWRWRPLPKSAQGLQLPEPEGGAAAHQPLREHAAVACAHP